MLLVKINSKHKQLKCCSQRMYKESVYYNSSFIILSPLIRLGVFVTEILRNHDTAIPRYRYTLKPLHHDTVTP